MHVELLHRTPLEIVVKAIRKCYASEDKSDSYDEPWFGYHLGPKDKALIQNIIKNDHTSTLEHLNFTFDIDGLSRAALQELARHRHASLSVKSTRYTLGEVKVHRCLEDCPTCNLMDFLVDANDVDVDWEGQHALCTLVKVVTANPDVSNDRLKYMLPEAFKTSLIWTINARSLRNFLKLRSSKKALWEMQELAKKVFALIPADMKFMFEDCVDSTN